MIKKIKSMGQNLKTTIPWPFLPLQLQVGAMLEDEGLFNQGVVKRKIISIRSPITSEIVQFTSHGQ